MRLTCAEYFSVASLYGQVDAFALNEFHRAVFDFPAEHWKHLRTTNVIESTFATVRLRERATRGAGSRTKRLLMAFKLLDMAQQRWAASGRRRPVAVGAWG